MLPIDFIRDNKGTLAFISMSATKLNQHLLATACPHPQNPCQPIIMNGTRFVRLRQLCCLLIQFVNLNAQLTIITIMKSSTSCWITHIVACNLHSMVNVIMRSSTARWVTHVATASSRLMLEAGLNVHHLRRTTILVIKCPSVWPRHNSVGRTRAQQRITNTRARRIIKFTVRVFLV